MHDSLSQTGQWLKSIVQGYFNYYAVPGNTASLSVFQHPVGTTHRGIPTAVANHAQIRTVLIQDHRQVGGTGELGQL
jgi:hypothetical protein